MTKYDLINKIKYWAELNSSQIDEVVLIGSNVATPSHKPITDESDWDLMIMKSKTHGSHSFYKDLIEIGMEFGILIHPLIIEYSDKEFKLKINHYKEAYMNGQTIFRSSNAI
jgi:hypothetical protein